MQAKITISLLSITIYLSGLALFWNDRASRKTQHTDSVTVTQDVTRLATVISEAVEKQAEPTAALAAKPKAPKANSLIVATIRDFNGEISKKKARRLALLIEKTAKRHRVDPLLVTALVSQESAFHDDAVSPVGAIGLGQLMPYTAADLGVDPNDPADNLDGCVRYLAQNLRMWAGESDPVALALASYNAGPGAVQSYQGVPPYEETEHYVDIITGRYRDLKQTRLAQALGRESHLSS